MTVTKKKKEKGIICPRCKRVVLKAIHTPVVRICCKCGRWFKVKDEEVTQRGTRGKRTPKAHG